MLPIAARRWDVASIYAGETGERLLGVTEGFTRHWWLFLLRGLLAILFGILALVQPATALMALLLVFGVWAFVDGVSAFALAFAGAGTWRLALIGLIGIAAGVLTFMRPEAAAQALYAVVAAWAVARGILEIALAIELRRQIEGEGWMIASGILSIVFGVLMIALPVAGVLALAWLVGVYALAFGGMLCALSFRLRKLRSPRAARPPVTAAPQPV
jgi:uncharacterized membrane protein HdeD (DUF308 family)